MFTQTQINLHNACADVLVAYQKHKEKVKHCSNALKNPGLYRHYTKEEYQSMMQESLLEMEDIKHTYIDVMKRMVSGIMNFNHIEEAETV